MMGKSLTDKFFYGFLYLFLLWRQISTLRTNLTGLSIAKGKRVDIAREYKLNLLNFHRV